MDLVLIIHREISVRETLASALSEAGCGALTAGTAEEGFALMGDASIPAALVGLHLPGMSGFGFLAEARKLCPEMEVIVLPDSATLDSAIDVRPGRGVRYSSRSVFGTGRGDVRGREGLQQGAPRP